MLSSSVSNRIVKTEFLLVAGSCIGSQLASYLSCSFTLSDFYVET